MSILIVLVDEFPKSCGRCELLDMVYGNECPLCVELIIDDINTRPLLCPLVLKTEYDISVVKGSDAEKASRLRDEILDHPIMRKIRGEE